MKVKYFLRGFGTGILFATIILTISFAYKSGMNNDSETTGATNVQETVSQEETTEETKEDGSVETSAGEGATTANDETTTVNVLDVTRGMSSTRVAKLLESMGIIESAEEFDAYLSENGYSKKILVGTYEIKPGYTYEEIAKIITKTD